MKDGTLDVEIDNVTCRPEQVTAARLRVAAAARDKDEAATFLDMLGIGQVLSWNMGGVIV